ncbi:MAG: hypothetical protein NPIRA06_28410 [Nitrospirales bacterium]|nr:MAG: hypothetical protein NPIRA06_28410 [Nitrospirales bacterium]
MASPFGLMPSNAASRKPKPGQPDFPITLMLKEFEMPIPLVLGIVDRVGAFPFRKTRRLPDTKLI